MAALRNKSLEPVPRQSCRVRGCLSQQETFQKERWGHSPEEEEGKRTPGGTPGNQKGFLGI